jgi:hypothetical protein
MNSGSGPLPAETLLWAHEDLNLGPLMSRNERHGIYQHKRGLTCGDAFVVVRHLLVVALCFAGFPRDGMPGSPVRSWEQVRIDYGHPEAPWPFT